MKEQPTRKNTNFQVNRLGIKSKGSLIDEILEKDVEILRLKQAIECIIRFTNT